MGLLLPHLDGLVVDGVVEVGERLRIEARTVTAGAPCPGCAIVSGRVHDRYRRRLADLAVGGRGVTVMLVVRRFRCENPACRRWTFVEQVEGLTYRHGRRSLLQRSALEAIGLSLAGKAGARLAARLGLTAAANTLLRLVDALPDPGLERAPRVLGVDDFALKRGHVYATILIDIEAGRPIDVLPDRTADTLAAWLRAHPGVEIVCRDRASAYAEAVRTASPDAVQVADRFHLWKNLAETVEKIVRAHRGCLTSPDDQPADADPAVGGEGPLAAGKRVVTTRERFSAVHDLHGKGVKIQKIAEVLGLDRKTVRRYVNAARPEDLTVTPQRSPRMLSPWVDYLNLRWSEGCTDGALLFRELQQRGYRGSSRSVRRWLEPLRGSPDPTPKLSTTPTVRQATGWITRHPDSLTSDEALRLKHILDTCPELAVTAAQVNSFATMMTNLQGHNLPDWITATEAIAPAPLQNFARHLRQDLDAVIAGLTLRWNSGPVEGHVNRIKMLKRQCYGRAGLRLLRRRILLTP